MRDMLPRLFFVHFCRTSFVAQAENQIVGFLAGFISHTFPEEAYVHFIGVHPQYRRSRVGCALYQQLFSVVGGYGCKVVRAVTGPANIGSVRFRLRMGFTIEPTDTCIDGLHVAKDYDGPGTDRVLFMRRLGN